MLMTSLPDIPVLLAWVVGLVLCVRYRRRYPKASLFTVAAILLLIADSVLRRYWVVYLPRDDAARTGMVLAYSSLFSSALRTFAWCLLLTAMFGARKTAAVFKTNAAPDAGPSSVAADDLVRRPWSVTLIGWALIALAVIGLIPLAFMPAVLQDLQRIRDLLVIGAVSCLLQIGIGLGMLLGKNWARVLYLWLVPVSIVIGVVFIEFRPSYVVRAVVYCLTAIVLIKPAAMQWFTASSAQSLD